MAPRLYKYTVPKLFKEAHANRTPHSSKRPGYEMDHMIDMQIVVAALNRLPKSTFKKRGWQSVLVEFFNGEDDMNEIRDEEHDEKSAAAMRLVRGAINTPEEVKQARPHIRRLRRNWEKMEDTLPAGFKRFADKMNEILYQEFTLDSGKIAKI